MADIPLTTQAGSLDAQSDDSGTQHQSSANPPVTGIPLGAEKGTFFETRAEEYADPNTSEKPPLEELLRPAETPSVPQNMPTDDPQSSSSIFQSPVVVDLRRKLAPVFSKPKRTIASDADAITQLAADTEQKFITSIKTAHGNK